MTLYEMSETARQLYELLESGEIDEQTVNDTMESIGASEKLESYVYVMKQIEAEIAAFKSEIERMQSRKQSLERQVDRLKQAQKDYMLATGQTSANAGLFKISLRKNTSCEIMDEALIPMQYMNEIPASFQPDKKAILAKLRSGEKVSGCDLKTGYSVMIK